MIEEIKGYTPNLEQLINKSLSAEIYCNSLMMKFRLNFYKNSNITIDDIILEHEKKSNKI